MSNLVLPAAQEILAASTAGEVTELLKRLLRALNSEDTQIDACAQLHALAEGLQKDANASSHLSMKVLHVPGVADPIKLLLNPAVFTPEFWGKTFAEGLLKNPEYFNGKTVVELGTGSGWVSLLLLQRTGATEILGLDINPVAIMVAELNKWLNGSSPDGSLRLSAAGIPIVKAFKTEVSDLLQTPLNRGQSFDRVIGCIPQVLHPVPEKSEQQTHDLSYQDLYDLSNYCFNQGILEDRFGLPLISRALEEAQLCLNQQGSLTLILGGRPGIDAIEEMFRRRGYNPRLTWVRRIQQADDTDLVQLIKLEEAFGIKFHFFVSPTSRQSIPASTAVGLKDKGEKIYHDLLVYQAENQFEKPMLGFLRNLHKLGLTQLRRELDLSRITDEQMSFLERLSKELLKTKAIPYPHEKGDLSLREKLSQFLHFYCHYQASPDGLFVGPERPQLLAMVLKMVSRPGDQVLLSSSLEELYGSICKQQELKLALGNNDLNELFRLDEVFGPKICIVAPYQLRDPSALILDTLIKHAEAHPDRCYLIDDSEHFEIGSKNQANLLLRLLGERSVPPNLIFIYGLIKNTVCPDFELSFLINAPDEWIDGLEKCAELSYSRISYVVELYYEWLFDELLSFPFNEEREKNPTHHESQSRLELSPAYNSIANDPVFAAKPIDLANKDLIRLDYGEFEYPVPDLLVKGLLKGFLESRSDSLPQILKERIVAYVKKTRHANISTESVVIGQGVFPLVSAVIMALKEKLGRAPVVAIPTGSYGPIYPLLQYHGAELIIIPTDSSNGFNITADHILNLKQKPDLIYLSQPSNPAGIFLEPETVRTLNKICSERDIYIFADEIFFLLSDSSMGSWTPAELSFAYGNLAGETSHLFFADGLAKSFAAGGLRCGFVVCPDVNWAQRVAQFCSAVPQAVMRSWDRLYSVFLEESPHQLIDSRKELKELHEYLTQARSLLTEHRSKLLEVLNKYSLADQIKYARRGALFTMAKLSNKATELAVQEHLLINPGEWARSDGWARICFSIPASKFEEAIDRLYSFLSRKQD